MTRADVRALAVEWADDPASVVEIVHAGFNADGVSGGFAFLCDRGVVIGEVDGGKSWSVDPGDPAARVALVERSWAASRHRNREMALGDLSAMHRAAVAALVRGAPSVGVLPPDARAGVDAAALPHADHLFVLVRRHARTPTEADALRALAANDWLLALPDEHQRAHGCPLCGRPAIGGPRYPAAVCDDCYPRTVCGEGRPVTGYNTSIGGGFEAKHGDDETVCRDVTAEGRCWIDGHECRMGEARFGGIYVIAVRPGAGARHA